MNEGIKEVLKSFKDKLGYRTLPEVWLFKKRDESSFKEIASLLKERGFKLININEQIVINPEDYNIAISKLGFKDPTGRLMLKDALISDEQQRSLIYRARLKEIGDTLDNKTVLVVRYNDQIVNGPRVFYETVRSMLKDGVQSNRSIKGIVYAETNDRIRDFLPYKYIFINPEEPVIDDPVVKEGEFSNNQEIRSVRLPNPVRVCAGAFKDCLSLESVDFDFGDGSGEIVIEYGAFDNCPKLNRVSFMVASNTRIQIHDEAFRNDAQQITFNTPLFRYDGLEEFAKKHPNIIIKRHL